MNYKDLQKVNSTLKKTNIKGKEYVEVKERINAFRQLYPEGFIKTETDYHPEEKKVICHAQVGFYYIDTKTENYFKPIPIILAEGTAYEIEGSSNINRGSYIENCETSAVGRALGMLGIGIDTAIATADEMRYAGVADEVTPVPATTPKNKKSDEQVAMENAFSEFCKTNKLNGGAILKNYKLTPATVTVEQLKKLIEGISGMLADPKAKDELPADWRL